MAGGGDRGVRPPAVALDDARTAELHVARLADRAPPRALRELLALQASDWAFMAGWQTAGDYPVQRARAHRQAFERALAGDPDLEAELRGLAPDLVSVGH